MLHFRLLCLCVAVVVMKQAEGNKMNYYLLQDILNRGEQEPSDSLEQQLPGNLLFEPESYRIRKDNSELLDRFRLQTRDDILLPNGPQPRKESLEQSLLYGHQYVQGGAGEGKQHLKPDGSIDNIQVIKSDAVLPAYCNPPNPCPVGYTAEDGCLEEFENSAAFSKEYQASQECMCDSEHMFNCLGNNNENELEALTRSIQTSDTIMDNALDKIIDNIDDKQKHKVVAKKFFTKRSPRSKRSTISQKHKEMKRSSKCVGGKCYRPNPFLAGPKLPVVAKKSPHTAKL